MHQKIISTCYQYNILLRYFTFLFCTKFLKSGMYFILTAYISSHQPYFKCSIASHMWLVTTIQDSAGLTHSLPIRLFDKELKLPILIHNWWNVNQYTTLENYSVLWKLRTGIPYKRGFLFLHVGFYSYSIEIMCILKDISKNVNTHTTCNNKTLATTQKSVNIKWVTKLHTLAQRRTT